MNAKAVKTRQWRRWSLGLLCMSVLAPLLSIGTMLYFYLQDETENRRSIAFLNFEQQAYRIKESLRDDTHFTLDLVDGRSTLRFLREPKALFLRNEQQLSPVFGKSTAQDLQLLQNNLERIADIQVLASNGQLLVSREILIGQRAGFAQQELKPGAYVALWHLDASFMPDNIPRDTHLVYIINQQSSLIYSSVADESAENVLKRPLVQDFIRSPLARAGTPLRTSKHGSTYGFYMAVPNSNLTLFVESSATHFFAALIGPTALALGILLAILGLTIFVWRSTVSSLQEEVRQLAFALDEFSKGYFIPTQLKSQSFLAELSPLVESINKNTRGVRDRVDLMEMQKK